MRSTGLILAQWSIFLMAAMAMLAFVACLVVAGGNHERRRAHGCQSLVSVIRAVLPHLARIMDLALCGLSARVWIGFILATTSVLAFASLGNAPAQEATSANSLAELA